MAVAFRLADIFSPDASVFLLLVERRLALSVSFPPAGYSAVVLSLALSYRPLSLAGVPLAPPKARKPAEQKRSRDVLFAVSLPLLDPRAAVLVVGSTAKR